MAWLDLADLARDATESVLGESATYTPPAGAPVVIVGLFDEAASEVSLSDGVVVQSTGPRFAVTLADLPGGAAVTGAALVVRSVAYTVQEIEPDGHGGALLRLSKP